MHFVSVFCAAALLALACGVAEAASPPQHKASALHYLQADDHDVPRLLAGPPVASATDQGRELEAVLARQAQASEADIARARSESTARPLAYITVLGPHFTQQTLPSTQALLLNAESDLEALAGPVRKAWSRPAPAAQDPRVKRLVGPQAVGSYPSEHAAVGRLWSGILALLFPNCAEPLTARAAELGDDRILAGAAYPSDVAAGRALADHVLLRLEESSVFQRDLAAAREEVKQAIAQRRAVGTSCRSGGKP